MYAYLSNEDHELVSTKALLLGTSLDTNSLKAEVWDNQVCCTETSLTTLIATHSATPNANRGSSTSVGTRFGVHCDSSKFQIVCLPVEPALSHLGKQGTGISMLPLVFVPQTRISRMLVFDMKHFHRFFHSHTMVI